ncbi:MAG: DUF4956 domain-containing protein [Paludibacter sp.]|jgi:hypothetical protein|nr:DUF4956 domain-containing protein [Paludibacter sp.]
MIQSDFPEFDPSIAQQYGDMSSGPAFMGIPLFDNDALIQLFLRFGFNMLICWIIIRYFYYKKSERKDFVYTFALFSVTIFLLIYLLNDVKLQIGMGLGLFAIFGILRYRTEQVSIREMTYLFTIIGISVINGLAMTLSYSTLIATNLLFLFVTLVESRLVVKHISSKIVLYEKIDLIKPEKIEELKADLENRTGLTILKIEVGHIDFLRDVAFLKVNYLLEGNEPNSIDAMTKLGQFNQIV